MWRIGIWINFLNLLVQATIRHGAGHQMIPEIWAYSKKIGVGEKIKKRGEHKILTGGKKVIQYNCQQKNIGGYFTLKNNYFLSKQWGRLHSPEEICFVKVNIYG